MSIKIGIHGSRSLDDERVKIIILDEMKKHKADIIVTHAEPDGVCNVARSIAKEKGVPLHLHFLNFKFLRGAFEHRSKAVIKDSDFSVFIHDGKSKGTSNEIELAKKNSLPHVVHVLEKKEFNKSVGFDVDGKWSFTELELAQIKLNID
jgi:hypothetical protein